MDGLATGMVMCKLRRSLRDTFGLCPILLSIPLLSDFKEATLGRANEKCQAKLRWLRYLSSLFAESGQMNQAGYQLRQLHFQPTPTL